MHSKPVSLTAAVPGHRTTRRLRTAPRARRTGSDQRTERPGVRTASAVGAGGLAASIAMVATVMIANGTYHASARSHGAAPLAEASPLSAPLRAYHARAQPLMKPSHTASVSRPRSEPVISQPRTYAPAVSSPAPSFVWSFSWPMPQEPSFPRGAGRDPWHGEHSSDGRPAWP
jgi:hypothetical protein